ncbi:MAG TPA: LysR family transcriptional regulator [Arthrobacter sp.]|nr:LysR family transcriptional regulator [Arthrobacter sp.]
MTSVTLRQLEILVAVVEEGTLAAAAQRLHMTAGTLSVALSSLEKTLGLQLLVRRRAKGAVLSRAGRELMETARRVVSSAGELEASAAAIRGELAGPLVIGCFDTLSPWLLPPVLEYFAEHHPAVDINVVEASSDELQRRMLHGDLDAAFMYQLHVDTDLERALVAAVRLQLVLPAGHRLSDRAEISFAELGDEPAVLLGLNPAPNLILSMTEAAGFVPNVRWQLRNVETIRSVVGRGLGYTVIMGRPSGDRTYDGHGLVYKRIADDLPENSVQLVYQSGALGNAKVRELHEFATTQLEGIADPMQHWAPEG